MPTPYIKKLAKNTKYTEAELEKKWEQAKAIAKKEGKEDNYAFITGIFKKMIGEALTLEEFKEVGYENITG